MGKMWQNSHMLQFSAFLLTKRPPNDFQQLEGSHNLRLHTL